MPVFCSADLWMCNEKQPLWNGRNAVHRLTEQWAKQGVEKKTVKNWQENT